MQPGDDVGKPSGHLWVHLPDRLRNGLAHPVEHPQDGVPPEWWVASAHRVQHTAKAKQVAARVNRLAPGLLRRHIVWGTGDNATLGDPLVGRGTGKPEVGDLDPLNAVLQ